MEEEEIIIFLSALSVVAGLLTSCVKYCSRSHCREISLCNHCIDIKRDDVEQPSHSIDESEDNENIPKFKYKTTQTMV
jgi:hypothetical protein